MADSQYELVGIAINEKKYSSNNLDFESTALTLYETKTYI